MEHMQLELGVISDLQVTTFHYNIILTIVLLFIKHLWCNRWNMHIILNNYFDI